MRNVTVLGTGLIGGSIGLGLRRALPEADITGYDRDQDTAGRALERGALTRVSSDPAEAVRDADVIVLAMPLGEYEPILGSIAAAVPTDATVTDVASAKQAVVALGESCVGARYVGGHPMAGSEHRGIEAADAALFEDAAWILTPTTMTSSVAYNTASQMAGFLGARVVAVDPHSHDALVARLSHVPQLIASALVDMAASAGDREALLGLAGGGFRDVTRIAASDPDLWVSILRTNKDAVLASLATMGETLTSTAAMIERESWSELGRWLQRARSARLDLFAKPDLGGEPIALSLVVPDRPGVLAEVTTEAGRLGANIEDLRIVHSTEGGRGRLELVVAGHEPADALTQALETLGYHVDRPEIDFST